MRELSETPRPRPRARRRESLVGLTVLLAAACIVVASLGARAKERSAPAVAASAAPARRFAAEKRRTEQALSIVSSLATAVDSLARVAVAGARSAEPAFPPPPPTEFSSPTACMLSYLPEIDVSNGALDFVCEETNAWTLDWKVRARISGKAGDGAKLWNRLGPYSMAALAGMRKGCCVDPPYLQAKVAGLWCGVLRDTLRGFQAVPTDENVHEFETTMKCLADRGMRLPPAFSEVTPERARGAFGEFLTIARRRGANRRDPDSNERREP